MKHGILNTDMNFDFFSKAKELIISIVPLSFIAAYCFTLGFYIAHGIDVATFLSIEDLTFDAVRWIAIAFFYLIVLAAILASFFNDNSKSILNKTIANSNVKWRLVIVSVIAMIITLLSFIYTIVQDLMSVFLAILFVIGIISMIISMLVNKIEIDKKWGLTDWSMFALISAVCICLIPFIGGANYSKIKTAQKVNIILDDNTVVKSDSNVIYIGKTANYFFIKNRKSKSVSAFSMSKVKSFEFLVNEK